MLDILKFYGRGFGIFILPWIAVAAFLYFQPFRSWFHDPKVDQAISRAEAFTAKIRSYSPAELGEMIGKAYAYARACDYKVNEETVASLVSASGLTASSFQQNGSLWTEVKSGAETVAILSSVSDNNPEMRSILCRSAIEDYGQYGTLIPALFE